MTILMSDIHKFVFGVFEDTKLVIVLNVAECNYAQAELIVGLLKLADDILLPRHYFAYDFCSKVEGV